MYFDVQGRPDLHKYLNICFQHSKNKDRKVQHREKDMRKNTKHKHNLRLTTPHDMSHHVIIYLMKTKQKCRSTV